MSDALERATEALAESFARAVAVEDAGRPCAVKVSPEHARTILAALREREQAIAAEREAIARMADNWTGSQDALAAAIRARGKEAGDA